jgi:beta-glucanase (GH16 family)
VRIYGVNGAAKDTCYLQLYNKGGVSWNEGMPKDPPPAEGMKLVFADDFSGPLSISSTDPKATYYDHKPPGGTQDFSSPMRFTSFDSSNNPFSQVDSYLRIRADGKKKSTGLISSVKSDGSGITASAPCYFECRFIAPDAKGSWPAFWLLTDSLDQPNGDHLPTDELDIIEAYGGDGPGSPNCPNLYRTTPHAWNQPGNKGLEEQANKDVHNPIDMNKFGISNWPDTFHIYGCKITDTDTIYYLDNVEVSRHKTMPTSKKSPFFFLINLGTGGGWPVDFSRYNNIGDMYVDYVRVYAGTPAAPAPTP